MSRSELGAGLVPLGFPRPGSQPSGWIRNSKLLTGELDEGVVDRLSGSADDGRPIILDVEG